VKSIKSNILRSNNTIEKMRLGMLRGKKPFALFCLGLFSGVSLFAASPVINSSPITLVDEYSLYSYTLTATDADNEVLEWSGVNLPQWLNFDAAPYVETIAGDGRRAFLDGNATTASFYYPRGLVQDSLGNIFVADTENGKIRKISSSGDVTIFAANTVFGKPHGMIIDGDDNLYITDSARHRVMKITPQEVVTTIAGSGSPGYLDGNSTSALFNSPEGITFDNNGNLFIADRQNNRVRKITPEGVVSTWAGSGESAIHADGNGTSAAISQPYSIACDSTNTLYVGQFSTIRKISPSGMVSTFIGVPSGGDVDAVGTSAKVSGVESMVVDNNNILYFADYGNNKIKQVLPSGLVSTIVGTGTQSGVDGNSSVATFYRPMGIFTDNSGSLLVSDTYNNIIRKVNLNSKLSGTPQQSDKGFHDVNITVSDGAATVSQSFTIEVRNANFPPVSSNMLKNGFVSQVQDFSVSDFNFTDIDNEDTLQGIIISALESAGSLSVNGSDVTLNQFIPVNDIDTLLWTPDENANGGLYGSFEFYVNDGETNSTQSYTATLNLVDIVDPINSVSQEENYELNLFNTNIDPDYLEWSEISLPSWLTFETTPQVSTVAGSSFGNLDAIGTNASFGRIYDIVEDSQGNYFVTDKSFNTIRKISPLGEVSTFTNDTILSSPRGITIDKDDNLYVANYNSHQILKITPQKDVSIFAGSQDFQSGNADGDATTARFNYPTDLCFDNRGDLVVADYYNHRIRKITPTGSVSTWAGSVNASPKDANGTDAVIGVPDSITCGDDGTLYVGSNKTIRKISPTGMVSTLAGTDAGLASTTGLALREDGSLLVSDGRNNKIRLVSPEGDVSTYLGTGIAGSTDGNSSVAQFNYTGGIYISKDKSLLIADTNNYKVRKYQIAPKLLGTPTNTDIGVHEVSLSVSSGDVNTTYNFNLEVLRVAHAPTSQDKDLYVVDSQTKAMGVSDIGFVDTNLDDSLQGIYITSLQTKAKLTFKGVDVIENQYIPVSEIGNLVWSVDKHLVASPYDSFGFKVFDGELNATQENFITIHVNNPNTEPLISSQTKLTIDENSQFVTTVIGEDIDEDKLSYSIVGGADASYFYLDPQSGILSFIRPPNAESPLDSNRDNTYEVQINVDDSNINFETVVPSDTAGNFDAAYGSSISMDGDYVLVGAPYADGLGAAYLLKEEDNGTFSRIQKISYPDNKPIALNPEFGLSVSLSGDYLAVGAIYDDYLDANNSNDNGGSVYIYKKDTTGTFMLHQQVVGDDTGSDDYFGRRVIIENETLIVSAPQHYHNGDKYTGKVYVFKQANDGNFSQEQSLVVDDISKNDLFGSALAYENGYLVIGARGHLRSRQEKTGLAYVFKEDSNGEFQKIAQLIPDDIDLGLNKQFGSGLNISGNTIVVSDPQYDSSGSFKGVGSAYIFENDGSDSFVQVQQFFGESTNSEKSRFARNPGLEDDTLVLGSPDENKAYIYKKSLDGNFVLRDTVEDRENRDGGLGYFATVKNSRIAIGHTTHNFSTGAVLFSKNGDTKNFIISVNDVNEVVDAPTAEPTPEPENNEILNTDASDIETGVELEGSEEGEEMITLTFNKESNGTKSTLEISKPEGKTIHTNYTSNAIEFSMDDAVASYNNNGTTEHSISVDNKETIAVSYIPGAKVEFTQEGGVQTSLEFQGSEIFVGAAKDGTSSSSITNTNGIASKVESKIQGTQTVVQEDGQVVVDTPELLSDSGNMITTKTTLDINGNSVVTAVKKLPDGTMVNIPLGNYAEGSEVKVAFINGAVVVEVITSIGVESFTLRCKRR